MTVAVAVLIVGVGSLLFRAVPLMAAARLPDRVAEQAEYAGVAVLTALVLRAVVLHRNPDVPTAPVVAFVATTAGLVFAYRGHSALTAVAAGAATYVVITAALAASL
jgi:branched-subunit amino acid transport protein